MLFLKRKSRLTQIKVGMVIFKLEISSVNLKFKKKKKKCIAAKFGFLLIKVTV